MDTNSPEGEEIEIRVELITCFGVWIKSLGENGGLYDRGVAIDWIRSQHVPCPVPEFTHALHFMIESGMVLLTDIGKRKKWIQFNPEFVAAAEAMQEKQRAAWREEKQLQKQISKEDRRKVREEIRQRRAMEIGREKIQPYIDLGEDIYMAMPPYERDEWNKATTVEGQLERHNQMKAVNPLYDQQEPDEVVSIQGIFAYLGTMYPDIPIMSKRLREEEGRGLRPSYLPKSDIPFFVPPAPDVFFEDGEEEGQDDEGGEG